MNRRHVRPITSSPRTPGARDLGAAGPGSTVQASRRTPGGSCSGEREGDVADDIVGAVPVASSAGTEASPVEHVVAEMHVSVPGQKWPCSSQQSPPAGTQPAPQGIAYAGHPASVAAPLDAHALGEIAHVPSSQQYGVSSLQHALWTPTQQTSVTGQHVPSPHEYVPGAHACAPATPTQLAPPTTPRATAQALSQEGRARRQLSRKRIRSPRKTRLATLPRTGATSQRSESSEHGPRRHGGRPRRPPSREFRPDSSGLPS